MPLDAPVTIARLPSIVRLAMKCFVFELVDADSPKIVHYDAAIAQLRKDAGGVGGNVLQ